MVRCKLALQNILMMRLRVSSLFYCATFLFSRTYCFDMISKSVKNSKLSLRYFYAGNTLWFTYFQHFPWIDWLIAKKLENNLILRKFGIYLYVICHLENTCKLKLNGQKRPFFKSIKFDVKNKKVLKISKSKNIIYYLKSTQIVFYHALVKFQMI